MLMTASQRVTVSHAHEDTTHEMYTDYARHYPVIDSQGINAAQAGAP